MKREQALSIVLATRADIPEILRLVRGLAEYEKLSSEVVATEQRLAESLFGATPGAEVVLARVGDTTVGFALFFHNYSTFLGQRGLYLEDLFVWPQYRARGYGDRLLQHLARLAVERGCGRFEGSVLDWNESAIRFYRKVGAVPMKGWTVFRLSGEALGRLARGPA